MLSLSWEMLRLIALVIVFVPVLVANLRTGNLSNWGSAAVLVMGVGIAMARPDAADMPWLFWIGGAAVWLGLFAALRLPGGVVKLALAFLPWFGDAGAYLWFISLAMLIAGAAGFVLRREQMPVAPGFLIAGLGLFAVAATG